MTVSTLKYADYISGSASAYEAYAQANPSFSSNSMSQVAFGTGLATVFAALGSYAKNAPFLKGLSQGVAPEVAFVDFGVNVAA